MDNIWYFDNINLYGVLCPTELKSYENKEGHFKLYKKGDFIYFKEDICKTIYLVTKGKVKIVSYTSDGEEVVKSVLSKGEIFGEKALLGEDQHDDFALAASGTKVCQVKLDDMHDLMRRHQKINLHVYKIIGLRLKKLERKLQAMLFKDVRTRLIEFIKDLSEERGVKKEDGIYVEHPFTQKDIADLIGSRRETVTSTLIELKNEGRIEYTRNSFTFKK